MHAGEAEKGRSQRANGGKLPAVNVETSKAAGKQEEKCTPARQRPAGASVQTEADCAPSQSRRPSWRGNRKKMHAGEAKKGRSQRANGGKIPAVIVETAKPGETREEKCTPAR